MVFVPSLSDAGQAPVERTGLPRLSPDQCRALLESASGGHLALSQGALPMVLPVTCRVSGDNLVVRAALAVLGRAPAQPGIVAFATSGSSPDERWRWEVVVQGRAEVAPLQLVPAGGDPGLLEPPELPLLAGDSTTVLCISMEIVTGWQFGTATVLPNQLKERVR